SNRDGGLPTDQHLGHDLRRSRCAGRQAVAAGQSRACASGSCSTGALIAPVEAATRVGQRTGPLMEPPLATPACCRSPQGEQTTSCLPVLESGITVQLRQTFVFLSVFTPELGSFRHSSVAVPSGVHSPLPTAVEAQASPSAS